MYNIGGYAPAYADHSSGKNPLKLVFDDEERGVRTSVAQRNTKALTRADRNVDPKLARRPQQRQRQQVCRAHHDALLMTRDVHA